MHRYATPDEAETAYYTAFAATDVALMGEVWTETAAAVCVHPGGDLLSGRAEVLRSWADILNGAQLPEVRYRVLQRMTSDQLAVHLVEELIRPSHSRDAPNRVLATNVYHRATDGWRMVAHHASLPLMTARPKPADAAPPTRRVH
ncbi:MAG: nuclear transport factor 2 family protein [Thiocapsa sp.]|jgi:ketosteroid isomerase-like protein|nr:nuclear transport factor 2 family protein [Thiocapsa sp.]MCG6895834.1 nuclear transport factor 2 family protein [Thiocapsa sp.]MCG6985223.1 nuclear transport factor 2 family protein [Thiocapsa sp.]